ncbi:MAG: MFS transporter [Patescibacteria group bacterium]|nr:MFS transporter [Patescibacteria group bacterium]MDE2589778.1 MFS transporter [Patescibacteria group bacterium]
MKKFFQGLTTSTILLAFSSLFSDISTEMLYPVLPIFITQVLGAPASVIGIIEGIATGVQYTIQGFSGWFSDKFQNRKRVALIGYGLNVISKPLMGFAIVWEHVLGARFFDRLGAGTRSAPRDALIAGSVNEQNRGKAFGLEGIGDNLGAFIGPLIALLLLYGIHVHIRTIFYMAAIPAFLAFIMILFVKEHKIEKTKTVIETHWNRFPKSYWKYILVTALFGIGNSSNAFLILRTKQIGIPLFTTFVIYAFFNLVAALSSYPAGFLSDKFGRKNVLLVSFLIFATTYSGFTVSTNFFVIGCLFVLYGVYSGVFRAAGKALASDFVSQELRASAIGWYSTTIGLTGFVASLVGGQLWTLINPQATFAYGVVSSILGTIALIFLVSSKKTT